MAETNELQPPDPGRPGPAVGERAAGRAVLAAAVAFAAVVIGSAALGVAAGLAWAAVAPRAVMVIVGHGSADVVNPETSAFIAADGWFSVLCLVGGIVTGLLGYLLAVRRHGAPAMLAILGGALAAALTARWIGQQSGAATFNHLLEVGRTGLLLRAPVTLGGLGALAFWPLAAGLTAGGIEAIRFYAERQRTPAEQPA